jgi:uncharacterized protein
MTTNQAEIIDEAFKCVISLCRKYAIDDSHGLKHSMEVLHFAEQIFASELPNNPNLEAQETAIYVAAILHDMCDKKYMKEADGVGDIRGWMEPVIGTEQMEVVVQIITSMSYSTVRKNGYKELGKYQLAYHIVREADLLAAYDIDRCVIFGMMVDGLGYGEAKVRARKLFDSRVLEYRNDGLFLTEYSKQKSAELHELAHNDNR